MISSLPIREDRKWYYLGLRHLRMAFRLMRSGYADGAVFHAYHGYEWVLSALIAAKGYPVPPEGWTTLRLPTGRVLQAYPSPQGMIPDHNAHKARIVFFDQLADRTESYYRDFNRLSRRDSVKASAPPKIAPCSATPARPTP